MIKKMVGHKLFPVLCVLTAIIVAPILCYVIFSEYNVSNEYHYQNWYHVKFDRSWNNSEIRAWNKLLDKAIPDLVKEFGQPPMEINIIIIKGDFARDKLPEGSAGYIYNDYQSCQKLYCPSPFDRAGVCIHELTHTFFNGYQPLDCFFQDGPAIYMQHNLGEMYKVIDCNNPKSYEYCYQLGDNFFKADSFILAPYGSTKNKEYIATSSIGGVCRVQYGLWGYFWRVINEKCPQFPRKFTRELWQTKPNNKGTVSRTECIKLSEKVFSGFTDWFIKRKSLELNNFMGDRFIVLAWPTENDLAILHWFTSEENGELVEASCFGGIKINIYKDGKLIENTEVSMQDGLSRNDGLIKNLKSKYGLPITVEAVTLGDNRKIITDKLKITQ